MIATDEDALICDFAEIYHILDYKSLRPSMIATLASGFPIDSRIKRKLSGNQYETNTYLLAAAIDRLSLLVWAQTKDGQKGRKRPTMLTDALRASESETEIFESIEAYEAAREKRLRGTQ